MRETKHFKQRTGQRGIKKDMVELALEFGEVVGDRHVLTDRAIHLAIEKLKATQKQLEHAKSKGGVTVVLNGETLITTYRTNSFRQKNKPKDRH